MVQTYKVTVAVPAVICGEFKIAAIKLLRLTSPIGLRDAKDKVENCIALDKPLTFEACAEDLMKVYVTRNIPIILNASIVSVVGALPALNIR
jgi:ribosomal protein L7/L12